RAARRRLLEGAGGQVVLASVQELLADRCPRVGRRRRTRLQPLEAVDGALRLAAAPIVRLRCARLGAELPEARIVAQRIQIVVALQPAAHLEAGVDRALQPLEGAVR